MNELEAENIRGILDAVLSNASVHSDLMKDDIRFYVIERGQGRFLFIKYVSKHRKIRIDDLRLFGTLPLVKDGKVRYGAFLMGERIRAAEGTLTVRRATSGSQDDYVPLEFVISLPLRV